MTSDTPDELFRALLEGRGFDGQGSAVAHKPTADAEAKEDDWTDPNLRPGGPLDIEHFRLFYGTSRARWKVLRRQNRLVGPHYRLCLGRHYLETEYSACEAVVRDVYYANLLKAAGHEVEYNDFQAAAAAYAPKGCSARWNGSTSTKRSWPRLRNNRWKKRAGASSRSKMVLSSRSLTGP
jgi:hypothetical protein